MKAHDQIKTELLRLDAFRHILLNEYHEGTEKTLPSTRLLLLFTSLLKLRQQASAVETLALDVYVEEILSISRTMAEVAINAAYLQEADDQEIERFQHFDTQSLYKHAEKLHPHTSVKLTPEQQSEIDMAVTTARAATSRKDSDPSWSVKSLFQRAEYSDQKSQLRIMLNLVLTVYAYGHHSVHGSNSSLQPFYRALGTGSVPHTEDRLADLAVALGGVNFVLYVFGIFVNSMLHLGRDQDLVDAGRIMAPQDNLAT